MLKSILIRWVVLAIAVGITTWLLPGIHFDGGFATLFLVSAVLGFLMAILKPIVMLLTCPLVVLTLGLFVLVINTLMLYITSWIFEGSLKIDSFWWALLASVIISAIAMLLNSALGEE